MSDGYEGGLALERDQWKQRAEAAERNQFVCEQHRYPYGITEDNNEQPSCHWCERLKIEQLERSCAAMRRKLEYHAWHAPEDCNKTNEWKGKCGCCTDSMSGNAGKDFVRRSKVESRDRQIAAMLAILEPMREQLNLAPKHIQEKWDKALGRI